MTPVSEAVERVRHQMQDAARYESRSASITIADLRAILADGARLTEQVSALETESAELTKALTGLTCGGSEFFIRKGDRFVADIPACVEWVRRAKMDAHKRSVEAMRETKELRETLTRMEKNDGQ
jgi:hypothetical protein